MAAIKPRQAPRPEAVTWDGSNDDELLDLVARVQEMGGWPGALTPGEALSMEVNEPDTLHPGLNIMREDGVIVARIEEGNTLVFDPFVRANGGAPAPLFVVTPEEFAAFYEVTD